MNPGQTITRRDGGLGLSGTVADRFLYVGTCSGGTVNTLATFYNSSTLRATLGGGPVVEAAAWELDTTGRPVDVLKTAAGIVSVTGTVTKVGTGLTTPTVAGTPVDFYDVQMVVALGGALGVGRFKYTCDGGQSWSDTLTIPAGGDYEIPGTGLTVTFPAGTYVLGDVFSFETTPATYDSDDLDDAWLTVMAANDSWPAVVFTGHAASASAGATIGTNIIDLMGQLVAKDRYGRAIVSTGEDTEANTLTAWAAVESPLVCRFFGTVRIANGAIAGGKNPRVPYVYEAARRAATVGLSTNPAWVGLPDSDALAKVSDPSHDADKAGSGLFDAKINCPRTFTGRRVAGHPTVLPNSFLMASAPSSDFRHWQWCRVIDVLSDTIQLIQQDWVNSNLETMTDGSGRVESASAKALEAVVLAALDEKLVKPVRDDGRKGHISGTPMYQIDRTNNILTTGELRSLGKVVPIGCVEHIVSTLGFSTEVA